MEGITTFFSFLGLPWWLVCKYSVAFLFLVLTQGRGTRKSPDRIFGLFIRVFNRLNGGVLLQTACSLARRPRSWGLHRQERG